MVILYTIFGIIGVCFATLIIGEVITKFLPTSLFANWWRKNIISECEECE